MGEESGGRRSAPSRLGRVVWPVHPQSIGRSDAVCNVQLQGGGETDRIGRAEQVARSVTRTSGRSDHATRSAGRPRSSACAKASCTTPSKWVFSRAAATRSLSLSCLLTVLPFQKAAFGRTQSERTRVLTLVRPLANPDVDLVALRQRSQEADS